MIKNPEFFDGSLPAGYDGLFDWDLIVKHALPRFSSVAFMDIDAVLEKNKRFLHFETKSSGSKIPQGQQITMRAYHSLGCVTYIILTFDTPEKNLSYINHIGVWYPNDENVTYLQKKGMSYEEKANILVNIVRGWYKDAENMGKLTIRKPVVKPSKLKSLWLRFKTKWDTTKIGGLFQR